MFKKKTFIPKNFSYGWKKSYSFILKKTLIVFIQATCSIFFIDWAKIQKKKIVIEEFCKPDERSARVRNAVQYLIISIQRRPDVLKIRD